MSKPDLHALFPNGSRSFFSRNAAELRAVAHPRTVKIEPADSCQPKPAKKRLRQNASGLNKTEAAFFEHLKNIWPTHAHHAQAITLRLGNGVRYTPDFASFARDSGEIVAHEVKGYMRDDAAVKIKVAAALYPQIRFRLATKAKGGTWDMQEILP